MPDTWRHYHYHHHPGHSHPSKALKARVDTVCKAACSGTTFRGCQSHPTEQCHHCKECIDTTDRRESTANATEAAAAKATANKIATKKAAAADKAAAKHAEKKVSADHEKVTRKTKSGTGPDENEEAAAEKAIADKVKAATAPLPPPQQHHQQPPTTAVPVVSPDAAVPSASVVRAVSVPGAAGRAMDKEIIQSLPHHTDRKSAAPVIRPNAEPDPTKVEHDKAARYSLPTVQMMEAARKQCIQQCVNTSYDHCVKVPSAECYACRDCCISVVKGSWQGK